VASGLVVDLPTLRAFLRRRITTQGLVTASVAAAVHTVWYQSVGGSYFGVNHWTIPLVIFTLLAYWSLVATTALAARLTQSLPEQRYLLSRAGSAAGPS